MPRLRRRAAGGAGDKRLKASTVECPSPQGYGKGRGYVVRPAAESGAVPFVLVQENRGLNPHVEDVLRRLALDRFIAFAPEALFPLDGPPGDEDKAREAFARLELLPVLAENDERINAA